MKRRLEAFEAEIQERLCREKEKGKAQESARVKAENEESRRQAEEAAQRAEAERREAEEQAKTNAEAEERRRQAKEVRLELAKERRRQAKDARQRAEAERTERGNLERDERERHIRLLAAVMEQVAIGQIEAAVSLFGTVEKRFSDLNYSAVETTLNQVKGERSRVETVLREAMDGLKSVESGSADRSTRFPVLPPVLNLRRCRTVRVQAAAAMAEAVKYLECVGGTSGEAVRGLLVELQGLDQEINQKAQRLSSLVGISGVIWAIALAVGG